MALQRADLGGQICHLSGQVGISGIKRGDLRGQVCVGGSERSDLGGQIRVSNIERGDLRSQVSHLALKGSVVGIQ